MMGKRRSWWRRRKWRRVQGWLRKLEMAYAESEAAIRVARKCCDYALEPPEEMRRGETTSDFARRRAVYRMAMDRMVTARLLMDRLSKRIVKARDPDLLDPGAMP
jgi:hypothetical protein